MLDELAVQYHKGDDVASLCKSWLSVVAHNIGMRNAGHIG